LKRRELFVSNLGVRVVDVVARIGRVAEVVRRDEFEPAVAGGVRFGFEACEGSESLEGADQRPSLSGAEWSKLGPQEEHAHLLAGPWLG
jgi:hypothetical protein